MSEQNGPAKALEAPLSFLSIVWLFALCSSSIPCPRRGHS